VGYIVVHRFRRCPQMTGCARFAKVLLICGHLSPLRLRSLPELRGLVAGLRLPSEKGRSSLFRIELRPLFPCFAPPCFALARLCAY
jgi:hypothetical protein